MGRHAAALAGAMPPLLQRFAVLGDVEASISSRSLTRSGTMKPITLSSTKVITPDQTSVATTP